MRRIGLFGGTFDPVHLGHLVLAEQCREQLLLDEIWFVPAGQNPHKAAGGTPGRARFEMLELGLAGHAQFRALKLELTRPGPSYTVDTLAELRRLHPDCAWWLLLGADSLADFPQWRDPEGIVHMARIAAVNRGDAPLAGLEAFRQRFGAVVDGVSIPGLAISASDLRERVRTGRSIRFLVPRSVEIYIQQRGLYRDGPA